MNNFGIAQTDNTSSPDNSRAAVMASGVVAEWNFSDGISIHNGQIARSIIKGNGYGVVGTPWVVVTDSLVSRNTNGVSGAAVHASRVFDNQADLIQGALSF